jgi:hypothetical protein
MHTNIIGSSVIRIGLLTLTLLHVILVVKMELVGFLVKDGMGVLVVKMELVGFVVKDGMGVPILTVSMGFRTTAGGFTFLGAPSSKGGIGFATGDRTYMQIYEFVSFSKAR